MLFETLDRMENLENQRLPPFRPRRPTRKPTATKPKALKKARTPSEHSRSSHDTTDTAPSSARCSSESVSDSGRKAPLPAPPTPSLLRALARSSNGSTVAPRMIAEFRDEEAPSSPLVDSTLKIDRFHSPAAQRAQLKAVFYDHYYAKDLFTSFCPSRWLLYHAEQTSPILLAQHALHLTQLGTMSSDLRVIHEALRIYQTSVFYLRRRLSVSKPVVGDDVLIIAHLLSLCELHTTMSSSGGGRGHHIKGIGNLLEARGAKSVNSSYTAKITLNMYWQSILCDSLLSRKRSKASRPEWLKVLETGDRCKWKITQLTSFVLQMPALFEQVDALLSQGEHASLEDVVDLMTRLKAYERDLRDWMNKWYAQFHASPYRRIPTTTCAWLKPQIEDDHSSEFPSAFEFEGTGSAKAHQIFWMSLLALTEAMKDLEELVPYPIMPGTTKAEQTEQLVAEIDECADNLCMGAMYMCRPDNGIDACVDACACIKFAARWYQKRGDHGKLAWCAMLRRGIEKSGIRAPKLDE